MLRAPGAALLRQTCHMVDLDHAALVADRAEHAVPPSAQAPQIR
jgi:hypothetical protein